MSEPRKAGIQCLADALAGGGGSGKPLFQAYLITCLINGRRYVGITSRSLKERWAEQPNGRKYRAAVWAGGKRIAAGWFATAEEAARARDVVAIATYGRTFRETQFRGGCMRPPPLWHSEALALRASGIGTQIIADRLDKSRTQVRWVLDEHGERDIARARTREIMQRDRQSARRATDKPEQHKPPRAQATRVSRATIDQAVRDFSNHLIDVPTLMARITPEKRA
jgi:hypothetical protein